MRMIGLALGAMLAIFAAAAPARAEDFPWCVEVDVFTKNCAFANYEECVAVARNAASPATGVGRCIRNPAYQPPPAAAKSAKPAAAKSSNNRR
jgi:hypothetical protein